MRKRFEAPCKVKVQNTEEFLHAHVEFDHTIRIWPGDRVTVHGDDVDVPFGETAVLDRTATIQRAPWWRQLWTRLTTQWEVDELYEVSFSPRRTL